MFESEWYFNNEPFPQEFVVVTGVDKWALSIQVSRQVQKWVPPPPASGEVLYVVLLEVYVYESPFVLSGGYIYISGMLSLSIIRSGQWEENYGGGGGGSKRVKKCPVVVVG